MLVGSYRITLNESNEFAPTQRHKFTASLGLGLNAWISALLITLDTSRQAIGIRVSINGLVSSSGRL